MHLILAIDDDKNTLILLDKQIQAMGYKMISAETGKKGLDLAKSGNPDLILLDIIMPEMDGFDVIRHLRKDDITKNTPIIMITAKSTKENVAEAMKLGVIDYISKPYNFFSLSKKIGIAIRYSSAIKVRNAYSQSSHVSITRDNGISIITFKTILSEESFIREFKTIFNSTFLKVIKKDKILLDLRSLPVFLDNDIKTLNNIISLFGSLNLHILAGKYYGDIVSMTELDEEIPLFISLGDFEIYSSGLE